MNVKRIDEETRIEGKNRRRNKEEKQDNRTKKQQRIQAENLVIG